MPARFSDGLRNKMMAPSGDGGNSFAELLNGGIINVYTGSQPATANAAETGDLVMQVLCEGNGSSVTSGGLTTGTLYYIKSLGTSSDFTSSGATANTVGTVFVGDDSVAPTWDGAELIAAPGLNLELSATTGRAAKPAADEWKGLVLQTGSAGWFRFYDSSYTQGADASAVRFDGAVATFGGQMQMVSTSLSVGSSQTLQEFNATLPA